jgi:hypothetical protein
VELGSNVVLNICQAGQSNIFQQGVLWQIEIDKCNFVSCRGESRLMRHQVRST